MHYHTLVLAALSLECILAQPAHRHIHKHRRNVDVSGVDFTKVDYSKGSPVDVSGVDFTKLDYGAKAAAPAPAPAPKVVNVIPLPVDNTKSETKADTIKSATSNGQSSKGSSGSGIVAGATGGASGGHFGGRTAGKQGDNKDVYVGNMGVPFGSNMLLVNTETAQTDNKYTVTFRNGGSSDIKVIVWQNPGRDGTPLGGKGEDPVITIPLGAQQSQAVAFDEDTHGAFSLDCARGGDGSTTCVRGEYNFGDLCPKQWDNPNGSQGWSGFDRSSIMGGANDNLSLECLNCGSNNGMSMKGKNEFTSDTQTHGGGSVAPGQAHILATFS
ncbi:MAG: hypothetical protein Q9220_001308 [cf. Caloplaca sp. 1 TL-2023]